MNKVLIAALLAAAGLAVAGESSARSSPGELDVGTRVSNVHFAQRPGTDTVDVWYDLTGSDSLARCQVTLDVSVDGGRTFTLRPSAVSGNIGGNVAGGTNRHIVWDAAADLGRLRNSSVVMLVKAEDYVRSASTGAKPRTPATSETRPVEMPAKPPAQKPVEESVPSGNEGAPVPQPAPAEEVRTAPPEVTTKRLLTPARVEPKPAPQPAPESQPIPTRAVEQPAAPAPAPEPRRAIPVDSTRMRQLTVNDRGFAEVLWLKDSSVMIRIPAGEFRMGSEGGEGGAEEQPQHSVLLGVYYIDKYDVTNRQYKQFCDAVGRAYPPDPGFTRMPYFTGYPNYPVVNVTWADAKAYCDWAGKSLPTEAQWEKAARGVDARKFPWGDDAPGAGGVFRANWGEGSDHENWTRDGFEYSSPVGSFEVGKSPYGCYDMAGDVAQWCRDWYDRDYYGMSPSSDPQGPASSVTRVLRGGGWHSAASRLRCAQRDGLNPSYSSRDVGFRGAATP